MSKSTQCFGSFVPSAMFLKVSKSRFQIFINCRAILKSIGTTTTISYSIDAVEQFSLAHSSLIPELAGASLNGELRLSQICCEILEAILNSIFSLFRVNV